MFNAIEIFIGLSLIIPGIHGLALSRYSLSLVTCLVEMHHRHRFNNQLHSLDTPPNGCGSSTTPPRYFPGDHHEGLMQNILYLCICQKVIDSTRCFPILLACQLTTGNIVAPEVPQEVCYCIYDRCRVLNVF
jgi:hypothetical protein